MLYILCTQNRYINTLLLASLLKIDICIILHFFSIKYHNVIPQMSVIAYPQPNRKVTVDVYLSIPVNANASTPNMLEPTNTSSVSHHDTLRLKMCILNHYIIPTLLLPQEFVDVGHHDYTVVACVDGKPVIFGQGANFSSALNGD